MNNKQEEIIQSIQSEQATHTAPKIPNPLKSEGITFEDDFGKKPLGLAHLTKDQGMIIILSLAGAFVGAAVAGVPLFAVILAAGLNDIKYVGSKSTPDEQKADKSQPQIEQETIEVPAQPVVEDGSQPQDVEDERSERANITTHEDVGHPRLSDLKLFPLRERAIALLKLLENEHFNLSRCIREQITCICGNQRGGKGTLMAILAILSKAIDPDTKIHYFTAGDDIYPFKCDRLVCRLTYPELDGDEADSRVAASLYQYLKEIDS